jgi:hypothetical protein
MMKIKKIKKKSHPNSLYSWGFKLNRKKIASALPSQLYIFK